MSSPFKVDQQTRSDVGEPPADEPVARLRHTLAAFADSPDDYVVMTATRNAYLDRDWTGLTMGDLRGLLEEVEAA